MQIVTTEALPIKMWLNNIEEGTLTQARNLANLPFTFKWVAIMPDAHAGYGMPIGGVLATTGMIIPNAVGVDIGCGMCAVQTNLKTLDQQQIKFLLGRIRERIPVGFNHHKQDKSWDGFNRAPDLQIIRQELKSARKQLGTLGGGNHFIEIQKSDAGRIWIMIHSGSRNFGLKIAKAYHEKALRFCQKERIALTDTQLAYFPVNNPEAREYLAAMDFALRFALQNRFEMMSTIQELFRELISGVTFEESINIHHNYASFETHFREDVIVHRKGATSARAGEIGIIPGSQGTRSFIVEGLGNPDSFMSCSHGAGRKLGRNQAVRTLNLAEEKARLYAQGIIHSIRNPSDLEEAAGAYKDIEEVMHQQKDLVRIVTALTPLAVIKG